MQNMLMAIENRRIRLVWIIFAFKIVPPCASGGPDMMHDEVVARLRHVLTEGEIPPGARIPERDLCASFAISRTPLREALKVLAAEGLVVLLPNRGSRAAKIGRASC